MSAETGLTDPQVTYDDAFEVAVDACRSAGKHLLNALRAVGIQPDTFSTQAEARRHTWPTPWAYDAWCAWHSCRLILERAGLSVSEISIDHRKTWRTTARYESAAG